MCGASSPVSLTSSHISQRGMLRLYFNTAIICPSRVTVLSHSPTLSWSHDTQIVFEAHHPFCPTPRSCQENDPVGFGPIDMHDEAANRCASHRSKPGGVVGDTEPLQRARNPDSAVERQCRVKARPETPENGMRKEDV